MNETVNIIEHVIFLLGKELFHGSSVKIHCEDSSQPLLVFQGFYIFGVLQGHFLLWQRHYFICWK